jgi:hypothetical protein
MYTDSSPEFWSSLQPKILLDISTAAYETHKSSELPECRVTKCYTRLKTEDKSKFQIFN